MRLFIASDIHGSAYYCDLLMKRIEEEKPDRIVLLGDHLYHGPRNDLPRDYDPKRVLASLNSVKDRIISVRGNCDSEVDQMVLEFPTMADYVMLCVDGLEIYATHGHVYSQDHPIPTASSIVLYGHTHVPANTVKDGVRYINPGSVSIPKNDSTFSYMVYEDRKFVWKDVTDGKEYDSFSL